MQNDKILSITEIIYEPSSSLGMDAMKTQSPVGTKEKGFHEFANSIIPVPSASGRKTYALRSGSYAVQANPADRCSTTAAMI